MNKSQIFFSFVLILLLIVGTFIPINAKPSPEKNKNLDQIYPGIKSGANPDKNLTGLVKILNYNIEFAGRDPNWKTVIKNENPDIILLVETGSKYTPGDKLDTLLENLSSYFPNEKPYQGISFDTDSDTDGQAVISRFPIVDSNVAEGIQLDNGDIYKINHPIMDATVDIFGKEVHFLVNHLSCCDSLPQRLLEQEAIMNYVDNLGDVPIIYGGDFNSGTPQDIGNVGPFQETLGTEPIEMMLDASHPHASKIHTFTDTYRTLNPNRKGYTLNSEGEYFSINHFRSRIDYIFVNQHLTNSLVNSSVVDDYPAALSSSDHKPMYTYFNFLPETEDLKPPIAPSDVEIVSSSSSQVELSWQASSSEDIWKYGIYRNGCVVAEVPQDQLTFTDSHLLEGSAVQKYEVVAVDLENNTGRPSLPVYVIPETGQLTPPPAPQLSATSIDDGIKLDWQISGDGGSPITSYIIYKYVGEELEATVGSDPEFNVEARVDSNASTYSVTGIRPGISIFFYMIAINEIGESSKSNTVNDVTGSLSTQNMNVQISTNSLQNEIMHIRTNQEELEECFVPQELITELPTTNNETDNTHTSTTTEEETNFRNFMFISFITLIPIAIIKNRKKFSILK